MVGYKYKCSALLLVTVLAVVVLTISAEDEINFAKMRVKELKKILDERGVSSEGIMEKSDLANLAEQNYHLPVVEKKEEKKESKLPPGGNSFNSKDHDLDEMIKNLQKENGMGNFNIFKPGDNMEDFMANMKKHPKYKPDDKGEF